MRHVVATRGSRLSLAQTGRVIGDLRAAFPDDEFDVLRVTTRGDRDTRPLFRMERRGAFEGEVDAAVAGGRADFAVHSMKDVPSDLPPGLVLACVPRRLPANDVLVCREGMEAPPRGGVVGTSSLRRAAQTRLEFPGVEVRPIRGNVDTRISRVGDTVDGVVLAHAGILRLNADVPRMVPLSTERFVPSPGQGALAVTARAGDRRTVSMLESIQDAPSRACAEAERAVSSVIESGCRFPVGAYARPDGRSVRILAAAYPPDGSAPAVARASGADPDAAGREAGGRLLEMGAGEFGPEWRRSLAEWTAP